MVLFKSLISIMKRLGDRTDPCGTPELIAFIEEQWPFTNASIELSEKI